MAVDLEERLRRYGAPLERAIAAGYAPTPWEVGGIRHGGGRRLRWLVVALVLVAVAAGTLVALLRPDDTGRLVSAGSAAPRGSSQGSWPAPQRSLATPLVGDVNVLEPVRETPQAWRQVSGSVSLNGEAIEFTASDSGAWAVDVGESTYQMTSDGLRVEMEPQRKLARVTWRDQAATSSASEPDQVTDDPAASPLPGENPTNNEIVNMVITPSYWLRNTVGRDASEVRLVGEEVVAGREAHRVQILFPSSAGSKYAPEGWTWWIDAERGTLLKWVIPFVPEAGAPPQAVEVTRIEFDHGERPVGIPEIPAGFRVETLVDVGDGSPRAETVVLEAATSAVALVDRLRTTDASADGP